MTPKTRLSQMILQGRYHPGSTLLHRMSPSLKLGLALIFFLTASWANLEVLCGLMLVCLLAMTLAHVPIRMIGTLIYAFRWLFLILGSLPFVHHTGCFGGVAQFSSVYDFLGRHAGWTGSLLQIAGNVFPVNDSWSAPLHLRH